MRRLSMRLTAFLTVLLSLSGSQSALAGTSGKISGTVVNSKTGEPIVGATVLLVGTNLGTMSDEDGDYFLLNVPSGKYDLAVSAIGFESLVKMEVRVLMDLTTPVDFEIKDVPVRLDEDVVVYATAPIIQKDLTASRVIFTADRLRTLPNIITVQSVLTNYPGVVTGRDFNIHIRGGRSGQVAYYFDGFSVQDQFSSNTGLRIMPQALEELSLTSGGYTAEYGEALSGVVSAVTREGGSTYHGSMKAYQGFTQPYDVNTGDWGNLSNEGNRSLAFDISGPMPGADPKRYTFFAAGEYLRSFGSLPHDWSIGYTGTAKLAMQPVAGLKLKANLTLYDADGDIYEHRDVNGVSYDFNLDGLPSFKKRAHLAGLSGNYHMNDHTVFSATVNQFHTYTKTAPGELMDLHWSKWPGYSEDSTGRYNGTVQDGNYGNDPDFSDPFQITGFTTGDDFDPTFRERELSYNSAKATILNQANKAHQIKAGVEYRKYDLKWDSRQFFNTNPFGETYDSKPTYAAAFLQDKIEYQAFIVNVGVRFDYRDADITYNATPRDSVVSWKKSDAKSRVSPRLGVSFPISEHSVMHFNYGIYYQVPRFTYMYTNLQGDVTSGLPLLGNPDLNPEQTVSYEIGLDHLIGDDLRLDITAYNKDVEDLVSTRSFFQVAGNPVTQFVNGDYGSVQGIDVSLEKLSLGGPFSGSISYGYMITKGNGSSALEPYYTYLTSNSDTLAPVSEFILDFDQRHTVHAVLDFRAGPDWTGHLFGIKLPTRWGLNMVGHYGSGLPYTATDAFGNRLAGRNEGRLPALYRVDMRFNKDFPIVKDYLMSFFVEVDNLFDKRNVINVYSRTGQPDNDGASIGAGLSLDADALSRADRLYDHDPLNYGTPRTIRTGIKINF